ncbi:hypothetical protein KDX10_32995 [Burkholderia cenocepacia]|uniref:hypothetical protein n=1 Tax=Burkholderia cenocepacia TaxID=95486 RepID=UPI001B9FF2F0|nr:hypothetical protein [Burkholderia cenocepacia]MBR8114462.1 hypothetical protein [Burkholderia cenocepacia]
MKHDDTDARELYVERAAIMQYDAGLPRHAAEYFASVAVWRYCQRTGAVPPRLADYHVLQRYFTASTPREPSEKGDG